MIGVWKHIDRLDTLGAVAGIQDDRQFNRECIGIARDVNSARWRNTLEDGRQDGFRAALAGWIENDGVPGSLCRSCQFLLNAATQEPYAGGWNPIQPDVHFRIPDGLQVFVDAADPRACSRERKRKQAAAAIQVEHAFRATDALCYTLL